MVCQVKNIKMLTLQKLHNSSLKKRLLPHHEKNKRNFLCLFRRLANRVVYWDSKFAKLQIYRLYYTYKKNRNSLVT